MNDSFHSFASISFLLLKVIFKTVLLLIAILTIVAIPNLLFNQDVLGFYFTDFIKSIFSPLLNLENFKSLKMNDPALTLQPLSVWDYLPKAYAYSMTVLAASFILVLSLSFIHVYIYLHLSLKIRKMILKVISLFESIPDILIIMLLQYGIILLYKNTGIKIFKVYGFDSNVYFLPIVCLTAVPLIMLTRLLITLFEEEYKKNYVEYAKAKGLSTMYIFSRHVLRNILYSLLQYLTFIYWIMMSSLIMIEYLFQMRGFTLLLYNSLNPDVILLGILLLIVPFGFIFLLVHLILAARRKGAIS